MLLQEIQIQMKNKEKTLVVKAGLSHVSDVAAWLVWFRLVVLGPSQGYYQRYQRYPSSIQKGGV
jgi:hypothetical protein